MPVVAMISFVTSPRRSMSLAVAMSVPSGTKMLGFSVPVTTSVDSPSRPMEVNPSTRSRPVFCRIQLSTVVLPAFLHMPTMDMVLADANAFSSSGTITHAPFRVFLIVCFIITDCGGKRKGQFYSNGSYSPRLCKDYFKKEGSFL